MLRRPFLLFIIIIAFLVAGAAWFIQSPRFIWVLKRTVSQYLPKDMGIDGDLSELSIKFFPPGFSIRHPKLAFRERNIAGIPSGSQIQAERIDFLFRPLQAFSGDIRIHEVTVVNGDVTVNLEPLLQKKKAATGKTAPPGDRFDFHWDELFKVRAEAIALENVHVELKFNSEDEKLDAIVESLRLGQWASSGGRGYSIQINMNGIEGAVLKKYSLPPQIEQFQANVNLNAAGLQIKELNTVFAGIHLSTEGTVNGNVLNPKELPASIHFKLFGPIQEMTRLKNDAFKEKIEGDLLLSGTLKGDLQNPLETVHLKGSAEGKNVAIKNWRTESLKAEFTWDADSEGGEIHLEKATLSAPVEAREGGMKPGGGGRIEIGSVLWRPGSSKPLEVPIRFENAHLHWLGAPAIRTLYPLDFRLQGHSFARFTRGTSEKPWELEVSLSNAATEFRLDNQKYQKRVPLKGIFSIPRIGVDGHLIVNSKGIYIPQLDLAMPRTRLQFKGMIDFKTGYDIRATGPVDFADLGQIAENDIRGQGSLVSWIHGPTDAVLVDLDLNIKDASYLHLLLGDFKGRITWDDGPSNLIFSQIQGDQSATLYTLNGRVELGAPGGNPVFLDIGIPKGNIKNFSKIFSYLTQKWSWFPTSLTGSMTGKLMVRGETDLSKLKVIGTIKGWNWDYWEEHFKSVSLEGGYDGGTFLLSRFEGLKRQGRFNGHYSFDPKKGYQWEFQTLGMTVTDLDHISKLDVPIRGKIDLTSSGMTRNGALQSSSLIDVTEFSVRGSPMPSSHLQLELNDQMARVEGFGMGGQGLIRLRYHFNPSQLSHFECELNELDFSPLLFMLNPKLIDDHQLSGLASGALRLSFRAGQSEKATGSLNISEYQLAKSGTLFQLARPVSANIVDGSFEVDDLRVFGPSSRGMNSDVTLNLKSKSGEIDGQVQGVLDAGIVEFFTTAISQVVGSSQLNFKLGGKLKQPSLSGQAGLAVSSMKLTSLDTTVENVGGILQLDQNRLSVQKIHGDVGGGHVNIDGHLNLFSDRYPEIDLKGNIKDVKIKVFPFQFVKASGSLEIQGNQLPYLIEGKLVVDSALSREKVLTQKQGPGSLQVMQYAPPPSRQGDTGYSRFQLKINVDAPKGVVIQNDLFRDVQAKGSVKVVNTIDAPRIIGSAEVIQGKLLFKDHIFQIQNAIAHFDNPTVINPRFDLSANTEVNNVKIQLYASGRMDKVKVELSSNPAMPESEIFSLLAVGLTSSDAKKLSATDLSAVQQGEAASLVLHSLDFNRDLEDKTGFQVQLDESVNPQQGVSAFRPQGQADSAAAPQIIIRRKIGDRLSLSAGRTFGTGTIQSNQVNLDFSVNRNFSITGVFNNYGTNGTADAQAVQQNSLGLDLKFQKRFK